MRRFQSPKRPRQNCPICNRLVAVDRLGRLTGHGPGTTGGSGIKGGSCDGSYRMAEIQPAPAGAK